MGTLGEKKGGNSHASVLEHVSLCGGGGGEGDGGRDERDAGRVGGGGAWCSCRQPGIRTYRAYQQGEFGNDLVLAGDRGLYLELWLPELLRMCRLIVE
jgi:hypothetical protein